MTPEERLTQLAEDIRIIRNSKKHISRFPATIKKEALALIKIFGSNPVEKHIKITGSLLYKWQRKAHSNTTTHSEPVLKITRCVIPTKDQKIHTPLMAFVKNGITFKIYNEAIGRKIIDGVLK